MDHVVNSNLVVVGADLAAELRLDAWLIERNWRVELLDPQGAPGFAGQPQQTQGTVAEVHSLLAAHPDVVRLHLIGHGQPGRLALGGGLDRDELVGLADEMARRRGRCAGRT